MPPARVLAPLRIAGSPVRACWASAPRMYCSIASCIAIWIRRPLAGGLALIERAQDRDRQQHAGAGVAEGRARLAGAPRALAGDAHRAPAGLRDHVEGQVVLVRAALAEALDLGVDQARVERVQHLPAEAQAFDRARRHVLDEDVGVLGHLLDERDAALGLEVDRDRFLVGVVDHEVVAVGTRRRSGADRAAGLAALGALDLDDLGPEHREDLGAGRARLELRQVEDSDAGQALRRYGVVVIHLVAPSLENKADGTAPRARPRAHGRTRASSHHRRPHRRNDRGARLESSRPTPPWRCALHAAGRAQIIPRGRAAVDREGGPVGAGLRPGAGHRVEVTAFRSPWPRARPWSAHPRRSRPGRARLIRARGPDSRPSPRIWFTVPS